MERRIGSLVVGDRSACKRDENQVVVHASKRCHSTITGSWKISPKHPHYLWLETDSDLYLNIVDAAVPIFRIELFQKYLEFAREHSNKQLVIHCDEGRSRSCMLAALYLAKVSQVIPDSFQEALEAYRELDPHCLPGAGITAFLAYHWPHL
jgi:hypothetical protein